MRTDLRDAFRALRATPVVTTVAVLSLAFGIGANTAIFSLVNTLMLRSLPVKDPQALVQLLGSPTRMSWTNPLWEQIRERQTQMFDGAFAYAHQRFNLSRGGEAQLVNGLLVSGRYFDVLAGSNWSRSFASMMTRPVACTIRIGITRMLVASPSRIISVTPRSYAFAPLCSNLDTAC